MHFALAKSKLQPFCQEKDRKEALRAFRDVLERQAPLRGAGWVLFFKQRQAMSPLEDCPRQGCVYLPGQRGWKQHTGAPSDLQGGSCYLPCGPSALRENSTPMLPSRKMQSHSVLLCATTRCSSNAKYTSSPERLSPTSSINLHVRTDEKMLSYWFKWSMFIKLVIETLNR